MKHTLTLLAIAAFTICCFSCKKSESTSATPTTDYLIVGSTGGFVGPMALTRYYLVNDGKLKADTTLTVSTLPTSYSGFHFNYTLPQAQYDAFAADVLTTVPSELFGATGNSIGTGMPDVGYTDVRVQLSGHYYAWHFESDQSGSSAAVQAFVAKMKKIVSL